MPESENERTLTKLDAGKKKRRMTEKQLANLRPATKETAAARGRKGGKRSQAVQREKKTLREALEILLSLPSKKRKGMSTLESGCVELVQEFERGNLRAWELLRDTIGQKPTEADSKRVSGNVIVSWQGGAGDIKAVTDGKAAGVQIDASAQAVAVAPDSNNVSE